MPYDSGITVAHYLPDWINRRTGDHHWTKLSHLDAWIMTCHNNTNVPGFASVTPLQDAIDYYSSLDNILSLVVENVPFGALLQGYGQRALAPVA